MRRPTFDHSSDPSLKATPLPSEALDRSFLAQGILMALYSLAVPHVKKSIHTSILLLFMMMTGRSLSHKQRTFLAKAWLVFLCVLTLSSSFL
jgi:hypothetical protein